MARPQAAPYQENPAAEPRRLINVKVTNENETTFSDDYNGARYVFPAGETVSIPLAAATHIFGFRTKNADGKTMFDHVCKRWGWNTPDNVKDKFATVKEIWAGFSFAPVAMRLVETAVVDTSALAEDAQEAEGAASIETEIGKQSIHEDTEAA